MIDENMALCYLLPLIWLESKCYTQNIIDIAKCCKKHATSLTHLSQTHMPKSSALYKFIVEAQTFCALAHHDKVLHNELFLWNSI